MQKGNLTALVPKKSRGWLYWINPLNFTPAKMYRNFIDTYFGFNEGISTYYYYDKDPEVIEFDLAPKLKSVDLIEKEPKAKVLEFNLNKIRKRRSFSVNFQGRRPRVSDGLRFEYAVKWILLNLKRSVRLREAKLALKKDPKVHSYKDFSLRRRLRLGGVEKEKVRIRNFVPVMEEVVRIKPYFKRLSSDKMYAIPMTKKPINKKYLSFVNIEKTRVLLAQHVQANPIDIELIGVYESFQYGLYSNIKHNPQTGNIMCFLDSNKKTARITKKPYLLIGKKRSDNQTFTVLADKDKLAF